MRIADLLLLDFDTEMAGVRRTLERIPADKPEWKPAEKSMPIGRLALHTAQLPDFCTSFFTTDEMDMAKEKWPDFVFHSTAHLLTELDRAAATAKEHVANSTDERMRGEWRLLFGGKVILQAPRMLLYRTMFLNHIVHHRAQLGVYLRLLRIAVPGLYGPSADEPFVAA